jgi:hypothetical protein
VRSDNKTTLPPNGKKSKSDVTYRNSDRTQTDRQTSHLSPGIESASRIYMREIDTKELFILLTSKNVPKPLGRFLSLELFPWIRHFLFILSVAFSIPVPYTSDSGDVNVQTFCPFQHYRNFCGGIPCPYQSSSFSLIPSCFTINRVKRRFFWRIFAILKLDPTKYLIPFSTLCHGQIQLRSFRR